MGFQHGSRSRFRGCERGQLRNNSLRRLHAQTEGALCERLRSFQKRCMAAVGLSTAAASALGSAAVATGAAVSCRGPSATGDRLVTATSGGQPAAASSAAASEAGWRVREPQTITLRAGRAVRRLHKRRVPPLRSTAWRLGGTVLQGLVWHACSRHATQDLSRGPSSLLVRRT